MSSLDKGRRDVFEETHREQEQTQKKRPLRGTWHIPVSVRGLACIMSRRSRALELGESLWYETGLDMMSEADVKADYSSSPFWDRLFPYCMLAVCAAADKDWPSTIHSFHTSRSQPCFCCVITVLCSHTLLDWKISFYFLWGKKNHCSGRSSFI